jgi:hypothetical protein
MKNILFIALILTFFPNSLFADISMTKVAEEKPSKVEPYDGLQNFLGIDYMKYKGQELFLIPKHKDLREYGYNNFFKSMNKDQIDKSSVFKCCDGFGSKYDALQGKYFIVEDVIADQKSIFKQEAYLKLRMKDTGENVYFKYSSEFEHSFPFLVVKYYETQKKFFVDHEVLIRPFPKIKGANQIKNTDINTGEEVTIDKGKYYKCIDVTIDQKHYHLSLLLQDEQGHKFLFPMYARYLDVIRILRKDEAESYRSKFGEKNWQAILDEKIIIGFTEEMAKLSWGEPDTINQSSYGDQWVYDNQCLYFKNGKLTAFN